MKRVSGPGRIAICGGVVAAVGLAMVIVNPLPQSMGIYGIAIAVIGAAMLVAAWILDGFTGGKDA